MGVTKAQYYEMCELMGSEPKEKDIPVEFSDFPPEVQTAFSVYNLLQDNWESMSGTYLGKNLTGITELLNLFDISDRERIYYISIIRKIDNVRQTIFSKKQKQEQALKKTHQ